MEPVFYCLIAGSRDFNDYDLMAEKMDFILQNYRRVTIVSGGARGADKFAERYAKERGYDLKIFPAEWDIYGKRAGYIRNEQMHRFLAEHDKRGCVLFWDGKSRGTAHNITLSKSYDIPLRIVYYEEIQKNQRRKNQHSEDDYEK